MPRKRRRLVERKKWDNYAKKRKPPATARVAILELQNDKCAYCGMSFMDYALRGTTIVPLVTVWDHVVPYSYSLNSKADNFVAACQICNGLKSDLVFDTLEDARAYVVLKRIRKNIQPCQADSLPNVAWPSRESPP